MFNDTVDMRRKQVATALAKRKANPFYDSNTPGVEIDNSAPGEASFNTANKEPTAPQPPVRTVTGEDTLVLPRSGPSAPAPITTQPVQSPELKRLAIDRAKLRRSVGI